MTTLEVVFRRAAEREFVEARAWYEEQRAGLGEEFTAQIELAVQSMARAPQRFPIVFGDVRCARARQFPDSILFRVEAERVLVLAVFHTRRNPLL